jgi:hypothetical protein
VEARDRLSILEKYFAVGSGSGLAILGREKSKQELGGLKVTGESCRWDILSMLGLDFA